MGFIGVQPATIPLTASDITNDIINADKIADNSISEEHLDPTIITGLSALSSEPADTDEFLFSDAGTLKRIDYSYIKGGGGLVYVGGANVSTSTTYIQVDNVFTSTYSNYLITYRLIPVTSGNLFDFQFRDGSSNTLDANEYEYTINGFSSNNVATYRDHTGDGKIRLTHGVNNDTSRGGLTGYMTVHEPDSGDRCVVHIHHMYPTDDASLRNGIGSGTYKNTGTAIAGFQFFGNGSTANDNTAQARIKVYGMVDS